MPDEFYNPFHFVPVAKPTLELMARSEVAKTPTARSTHQHVTHDRYLSTSLDAAKKSQQVYSGRILCRLKIVTPTVLGAHRTEASQTKPAEVFPFEVPALRDGKWVMEPAIPESSLRGMISSLYETLTNSALRVLNDTAYSVRVDMRESYQAVGIVQVAHGSDGKERRNIVPLSFPGLRNGKIEKPYQVFERSMQLKVYLGGIQSRWDSFCADNLQIVFLKEPTASVDASQHVVKEHTVVGYQNGLEKNSFLVGRRIHNPALLTRDQWNERRERNEDLSDYVPGILRNLGRASSDEIKKKREDSDRQNDMPSNVKDVWFIPLTETLYDPISNQWRLDEDDIQKIDAETAIREFEAMAKERTLDNPELPYEPRGSHRNSKLMQHRRPRKDNEAHAIRLRHGDLVCFRFETLEHRMATNGNALSLSISSIWRRATGNTWDWFQQIDRNLLPMHSARPEVTLAEQLFGYVESEASKSSAESKMQKTLAGRLRFSTGRLVQNGNRGNHYLPKGVLPILGSPKPPSPRLYFRRKGTQDGVGKKDLPRTAAADVLPQGRKQYLIHSQFIGEDERIRSWVTIAPNEHTKQKAAVRPLRPGSEFEFEIRFDNLSHVELSVLLLALKPNDHFLHRLGMAKPLGLGVVELTPVTVEFVERQKRYAVDRMDAARHHEVWNYDESAATSQWGQIVGDARQRLANSPVLTIVELLGDPESTRRHPVHYPRLSDPRLPKRAGKADIESELFKWHTENEKSDNPQSLAPIPTTPLPKLPTLLK